MCYLFILFHYRHAEDILVIEVNFNDEKFLLLLGVGLIIRESPQCHGQ